MASGKKKKNAKKKKKKGILRRLGLMGFFVLLLLALPGINWVVQAVKKPTEILGLFDSRFVKTPKQTWLTYKDDFEENSTATITPTFLAALAQIESNGNPIARTFWRFNPDAASLARIYAPASSAVGLFQITSGTFERMKKRCIHDNKVAKDGKWYEPDSCWFNWAYLRFLPSHSIEMTSANLDYQTNRILKKLGKTNVSLRKKQDLATIIHLCGKRKGRLFARRGFSPNTPKRCGSHTTKIYLSRLHRYQRLFNKFR